MDEYTPPSLTVLGSITDLTAEPAQGGAYGKGSTTPDGGSGLIGNRSGG